MVFTALRSLSLLPDKFIKLKLLSDIETHTLWKLTRSQFFPQDIEFAPAPAEFTPSIETDEKCLPIFCNGADKPPSQVN